MRRSPLLLALAVLSAVAESCKFNHNTIREGFTYNDPSKTLTSSGHECCNLCCSQDRCVTWSRDKWTGACGLKDRAVELRYNPRFDSGIIGGQTALDNVPPDTDCHVTFGKNFDGDAFEDSFTSSADECCRKCQDNFRCYSWARFRKSGKCQLKSWVPAGFKDRSVDGGVVF